MATTFLEPGGDATFNVANTTNGGFWGLKNGAVDVATDFVHGSHIKSIKYNPAGSGDLVRTPGGTAADAGTRFSAYFYFNALPSSNASFFRIVSATNADQLDLYLDASGVLTLADAAATQIGGTGATLSTGTWYRISFAYTITSTTVNEFRVWVNGSLSITATNATINVNGAATNKWQIGNNFANSTLDFRSSDHYSDNSSSLTDTGDIWVTAKRPNANGTSNQFTTQIGAGGSGYGTGHSPQVNERPLSTTNGWSFAVSGVAKTEEYNIESKATGDINISTATIVDFVGWVYASSVSSETASIVLAGTSSNISLTSTNTMFTKVAGSTTYPPGTGTDIGIITSTTLTTVSLYECGVMVAYTPAAAGGSSVYTTQLLTRVGM